MTPSAALPSPRSPWIKVCGVRSFADLEACAKAGATHVGVNTWPQSPRAVSPREARALVRGARSLGLVPVVLHLSGSLLPFTGAARLGAPFLQLYARPPARDEAALAALRVSVIESRPAASSSSVEALPWGQVLLLDAARPGNPGGTGSPFDWSLCGLAPRPFILAGGLGPENVAQAVHRARPAGVDAASRLESRPGVKDAGRIREFCASARQAFMEIAHAL